MEQQQFKGKMEWTGGSPAAYLVFLLSSYVLTGVLLLLLAFLLYQFQWSEKAVKIGIVCIYLLSTFLAGFLAGKKAKNKKFLWGLFMGIGYYGILAIMSMLLKSPGSGMEIVTTFLLCAGGGTLGGMLS